MNIIAASGPLLAWLLQITFFGLLAGGATWFARRGPLGVVGAALIMCWFITTIAFFGTTFGSRVVLEMGQAVMLVSAARLAHLARPSWSALIVVCLCIADMAFCASLVWEWIAPAWLEYVYDTVTNAIFTINCLAVGGPGAWNAAVDKFRRRDDRRAVGGAYRARHVGDDAP